MVNLGRIKLSLDRATVTVINWVFFISGMTEVRDGRTKIVLRQHVIRKLAKHITARDADLRVALEWMRTHRLMSFRDHHPEEAVMDVTNMRVFTEQQICHGCNVGATTAFRYLGPQPIPRTGMEFPPCSVVHTDTPPLSGGEVRFLVAEYPVSTNGIGDTLPANVREQVDVRPQGGPDTAGAPPAPAPTHVVLPTTSVAMPIPDPAKVGDEEVPMPVHAVQHNVAAVQVTDPEDDEPEVTIVYEDEDDVTDDADVMEDEVAGSESLPPDQPIAQPPPAAEGLAATRDPVREAVEELVAYLQVDEQDLRLEDGFSALATRRAARRLRLEPFFAPLLSGNADEALVYGQKFRDEMMGDLREVDRALSAHAVAARPAAPITLTVAARLRAVADTLLNEQVADLLNKVRRFLLTFRAARARFADAYGALNLYTVECLPRIRALMPALDLAEFQFQNLHSAAARESIEATVQTLTDMQAEWARRYGVYEPHDAELHRIQGEFSQLVESAAILSRRITSFIDTCALLEEGLSLALDQELEEAIVQLQLAQAKREAYGSTSRYVIPPELSELADRIQSSRTILERYDGVQAHAAAPTMRADDDMSTPVLFHTVRRRDEELEALMLLAAVYHVPGTGKRPRKGKSIDFYVKLLVSAGVITPGEAVIAKERISKLRKALFSYVRDGRTHRYTPNALALERVERYRSELVDADAFHARIDQAWIRYKEEYAQARSASKAGK